LEQALGLLLHKMDLNQNSLISLWLDTWKENMNH